MEKPIKELTIKRTFDAPRELVWKAWTDPKLLRQWFGPRGVTNPICEVDARKGGEIYIVMEAGEELGPAKGMRWPMKGKFDEVVPYERFVFTGGALDDKKDIMLVNRQTVTLEEVDGKTEMTLHVAVIMVTKNAGAAIAGMTAGFNQQIDKLGEFLMKAK